MSNMKAEVKDYYSPDVENLWAYTPKKADDFALLLQVFVGPEGSNAQESFDFQVCTPKWLERKCEKDGVIFGRFLVIVYEYDFKKLQLRIENLISEASIYSYDWQDIATKISRFGHWEFEDYEP